jgi:predicted amidohydrolase
MKAAAIQLEAVVGQPEENLERVELSVRKAAAAGCELVVLPEMIDTGYVMEEIASTASSWDELFVPGLRAIAAECDLNIVCGVSERAGENVFNAVAVIDRAGQIAGHYRKVHLFSPAGEDRTCTAGDGLVAVELDGVRWGVAVCYDIRFPELVRRLVFDGVQGLLIPSAFPFPRLDHWRVLLRARAMENQCIVVAANRVGTDGALTFCGASQIIDPYGTVIASAGEIGDTMATAELDIDQVDAVRAAIPALSSARPEVYGGPIRQDVSVPANVSAHAPAAPQTDG